LLFGIFDFNGLIYKGVEQFKIDRLKLASNKTLVDVRLVRNPSYRNTPCRQIFQNMIGECSTGCLRYDGLELGSFLRRSDFRLFAPLGLFLVARAKPTWDWGRRHCL